MKAKFTMSAVMVLMALLMAVSACAIGEANPGGDESDNVNYTNILHPEKVIIYQNGEAHESTDTEFSGYLVSLLGKVNLQARCAFSQEDIQEIKQKDCAAELILTEPGDAVIAQFVEPEERHHIPTTEDGYRILEKVKSAIFILEDNLGRGLQANILVGSLHEGKVGYGCWAIKQEESNELDRRWLQEVVSLCGLEVEIELPSPGEDEMVEIHRVSQEESQEIARNYLLNCPTFRFDGIKDTVKLAATNQGVCPYCWQFVFEFDCLHAGYGDRTGQYVAEVITSHTARITVEQGDIISAIMDDRWDMRKQEKIEKDNAGLPEPKPMEIETVN